MLLLRDDLKRCYGITEDTIRKYQRAITKAGGGGGGGKKARAPAAFNKPVTRKVAVEFSMLDRSGVAGLSQGVEDAATWQQAKVAVGCEVDEGPRVGWLILYAQFLKIAEAEDGVSFDYDDDDDEGDDHERDEEWKGGGRFPEFKEPRL